MGSVTARKRGTKWEYRYEIASQAGKRQWDTKGGFRTKAEALEAGNVAYNEYKNSGLKFSPNNISVSDYLDYYYDTYCKINLGDATLRNYEKKIRLYIKPFLGKYELQSLNASVCQEFINHIFNEGYSKNSRIVIKSILNKALNYAVEPLHYIRSNPLLYVRNPLPNAVPDKPVKKKIREAVTPEQWKAIIARFPEGSSCHVPLMLAYHCGLRLGEIFALTWDDIDFDNNKIDINKQIQMESSGYWTLCAPKYNSYRKIAMSTTLSSLLKREKAKQDKARPYYDEYYAHQYVNPQRQLIQDIQGYTVPEGGTEIFLINVRENGTYCQPRITQHLGRIVHYQLGFPLFDMHSLRHTHCCMLLEEGAPIKFVQQRLGHKDIETTLNIYAHLTDKMEEQGVEILNRL